MVKRAFEIASVVYKTKAEAHQRWRSIRDREGARGGGTIDDEAEFAFFAEAIQCTEKYKTNLVQAVYVLSDPDYGHTNFAVYCDILDVTTGEITRSDAVNRKDAVHAAHGSIPAGYHETQRCLRARKAVGLQTWEFRKSHIFPGATCSVATCDSHGPFEVDHNHVGFSCIYKRFLAEHPSATFRRDCALLETWRAYHADTWSPHLLCVPCHAVKTEAERIERTRRE